VAVYRFLRRPGWVFTHVLIAVIAAVLVSLGFWQLRRLDQRQATNAAIRQRLAAPPVELADVEAGTGALAYRRVSVTGEYRAEAEVLLSGRSRDGVPGHHVLTPLITQDGATVVVDRGWVPFELDEPPIEPAAPPAGEVRIEGTLRRPRTASGFGPRGGGRLDYVSAVDLDRLADQLPGQPYPAYVVLRDQSPASTGQLPRTLQPPELAEGNHLSYAVQWFCFAAVALAGYVGLVRHVARRGSSDDGATAGAEPPRQPTTAAR
jgi:cytochrome oxidase assembly protein ShyY1